MHHPPLGSSTDFECFSWRGFGGRNFKCPYGTAIWRVHLFRLGWRIEIMRVNVEEVVLLSHSGANPDGEIVGSVLDIPTRRQIIVRELLSQDVSDFGNVLDERPNGFSAYL